MKKDWRTVFSTRPTNVNDGPTQVDRTIRMDVVELPDDEKTVVGVDTPLAIRLPAIDEHAAPPKPARRSGGSGGRAAGSPKAAGAPKKVKAGITGIPFDPRRFADLPRMKPRLRRWLLTALGAAALGAVVTPRILRPVYEATVVVSLTPQANAMQQQALVTAFTDAVTLPSNVARVAEQLGDPPGLVGGLTSALHVNPTRSDAIVISATAQRPERAAALANTATEVVMSERRSLMAARSVEIATALRALLAQRDKSLEEVTERYAKFLKENHVVNVEVEHQAAARELARVHDLEHDVRIESEASRAMLASLRAASKTTPEHVVVTETADTTRAVGVESLKADLARATAIYTDEHPTVQALKAELATAEAGKTERAPVMRTLGRSALHDTLNGRIAEATAGERSSEEKRRSITELVKECEQRLNHLASISDEDSRMQADIKVQRDQRASLLTQIAQAEQDVRAATSDFVIVSRATPPTSPARSMRDRGAAFLGFACFFVGLLWELRPHRLRSPREAGFWSGAAQAFGTTYPAPEATLDSAAEELAGVIHDHRPARVAVASLRDGQEVVALTRQTERSLSSMNMTSRRVDLGDWSSQRNRPSVIEHDVTFVRCGIFTDSLKELRTARRQVDMLVLMVPTGVPVWTLRGLAAKVGIDGAALVVVTTGVEPTMAEG